MYGSGNKCLIFIRQVLVEIGNSVVVARAVVHFGLIEVVRIPKLKMIIRI